MLTVYGIETITNISSSRNNLILNSCNSAYRLRYWNEVAPLSSLELSLTLQQCLPFTVLKLVAQMLMQLVVLVATVLTVYGIETDILKYYEHEHCCLSCNSAYRLRYWNLQSYPLGYYSSIRLQQCLPFTVLKLTEYWSYTINNSICCNSAYRLRYWNEWFL